MLTRPDEHMPYIIQLHIMSKREREKEGGWRKTEGGEREWEGAARGGGEETEGRRSFQ